MAPLPLVPQATDRPGAPAEFAEMGLITSGVTASVRVRHHASEAWVGRGRSWVRTRITGPHDGCEPPLDLRAYDAGSRLLTLATTRG